MFTLLPPHVLAVSERALTDNQKMFLALLKKQATMNGTNESLMSASDSASELCGFCKRTLYNSVRPRLVELGLITPRIGEHGGKKINYYTLNTDRLNDRDFFNELNKEYDMAKKTPKKENKNELRRLKKEIEELKNEVTQLKNYLYTCIPKNSNGYTAENVDKQEVHDLYTCIPDNVPKYTPKYTAENADNQQVFLYTQNQKNSNGYTAENVDKQEVHDLYTCIPDNVPKYTPKYTAENADNQQVFLYTQNQKNDKGYTYDMICNEINTLLQNLLVTGTSQEKIPERKLTYSHAHARVDEHVGDEILDLLEDGNPDGQANSPQPGSEISAEKNLPLSGSDASAQESEPQPEGTTNEDEDVPFDEFVLNPKQPSGKATSVATKTTPQSGKKIKAEMPPAAAPVAPQKTEIPSGAQKRPVSNFNPSGGPTIHPTQKNRSEAIYEGSLEDYLKEQARMECEILDEINSYHKGTGVDVGKYIKTFNENMTLLKHERNEDQAIKYMNAAWDSLISIGETWAEPTPKQEDMVQRMKASFDKMSAGKAKYFEKKRNGNTTHKQTDPQEPDTPYRSINELMDDNGTLSVTVEPETPYGKRNELARRAVYRKTG